MIGTERPQRKGRHAIDAKGCASPGTRGCVSAQSYQREKVGGGRYQQRSCVCRDCDWFLHAIQAIRVTSCYCLNAEGFGGIRIIQDVLVPNPRPCLSSCDPLTVISKTFLFLSLQLIFAI